MTTKTTGAEWKRFYTDKSAWPEGAWHDDEEIVIDGEARDLDADLSSVPDCAQMTISGGVVFLREDADDGPTLEAHFRSWRKKQNTVFLTVEAPREKADAVRAAVVEAGGKVKG